MCVCLCVSTCVYAREFVCAGIKFTMLCMEMFVNFCRFCFPVYYLPLMYIFMGSDAFPSVFETLKALYKFPIIIISRIKVKTLRQSLIFLCCLLYHLPGIFFLTNWTHSVKHFINSGGPNSSVVREADSWSKGRGFESLQERRENSSPGSTFCADSFFGIRFIPVLQQ